MVLGDARRGCGTGKERDGFSGSPPGVRKERSRPPVGRPRCSPPHPTAADELRLPSLKRTYPRLRAES